MEANRKNNQKNVSIEYITNKRVEWLYEVRNVLAEYIALSQECANRIMKSENAKIPKSIYRKINIHLAKLKMLFNFTGDYGKEILDLLDIIKNNIFDAGQFDDGKFENDIILLTKYAQVYLKIEWELVKYEIRNQENLILERDERRMLKEKYFKLNDLEISK